VLLSVPLLVLALERGSSQLFWVPPLSGSVLGQTAQTLISAAMPAKFYATSTTVVAEVVIGALLLAALVLAVRTGRGLKNTTFARSLWLVIAWLVVPTFVALVVSDAGKPIELDRCSILLMPAVSLLLVWALLHTSVPRWLGVLLLAAVLALRLVQIVPSYGSSPEDWKAATADVLRADGGRLGCVAFYPQDGRQVFDYYLSGRGAQLKPVLPTLPWSQVKPYVEQYRTLDAAALSRIAAGCPRLFLLASHVGQSSGPAVSRVHAARYVTLQHQLASRYPHHSTTKFSWAGPVYVTEYSR
jgi:hypothetical protein